MSFSWKASRTPRATNSAAAQVQRWPVVTAIESAALGGGEVEVGVGQDDDGVVAAHLEGEQLARLVERRFFSARPAA